MKAKLVVALLLIFTIILLTAAMKFVLTPPLKEEVYHIEPEVPITLSNCVFDNKVPNRLSLEDKRRFVENVEIYSRKFMIDPRLFYVFASIESDFYLKAYNRRTKATGIFQITPICLREYNNYHVNKLTLDNMFEMSHSFEVTGWYINRLKHHYKIPYQFRDLYWSFNAGPIAYKRNGRWAVERFERNFTVMMDAFENTKYSQN
jgi:hypothetical protein